MSARLPADDRRSEQVDGGPSTARHAPRSGRPSAAGRACLPGCAPAVAASLVFLGLLGPGLIAANAGNDAGGVATYS